MEFIPLGQQVACRDRSPEEARVGQILLPEGAREQMPEAVVFAVGEEVEGVAVGDTILYRPLAGTHFVLDGERVLLLDASQIFGVVLRG